MIEDLFDGIEYFQRYTIYNLPAEDRQIDALLLIAQLIRMEPEHAIQLEMSNNNDPREIHFAWQGEGYKVILTYPMEDYNWPNPLLLCGEDLAYEDVEEILRGICLEEKESDSIPVIMNHFRNVTSEAFGDLTLDGDSN